MSWEEVSIKDVAKVSTGKTPSKKKPEYFGGDIPFITPGELNISTYVEDAKQTLTTEGANQINLVPKNSVLVCCIGSLGKLAIAKKEVATNQQINSVTFDPDYVDYKFGFYALKLLKPTLEAIAPSTTVAIVNKSRFESLKIPLPPLPEQKCIAAILDKADAIRRKRQQAIDLADQYLRSVFLDMFGSSLAPKSDDNISMTDCFDITTGKLNSNAAVENGEFPFFTCAKEAFAIDHYAFDQEALLLAGNNAQAEYDVKHYNGKFNAYQRTYVLSLKRNDWSYPFYKFALEYQLQNLKRASKGSNTKYITMEIMERTMLPAPSPKKQKEFVSYFLVHKSLGNAFKKSTSESDKQFNALSQQAFAGKL